MLRDLDAQELVYWEVLEQADPYGQVREDYRAALFTFHLVSLYAAKDSNLKLDNFLLKFSSLDAPEEKEASVEGIERAFKIWAAAANARFAKKGRH